MPPLTTPSPQLTADLDWRDRHYTFEEYCALVPPDDRRFELIDGKLTPMAATAALHQDICRYLAYWLERAIAELELDLVVCTAAGVRTGRTQSRIPDLTVCHQSLWQAVKAKPGAGVLDFDQQPVLVGEVVSQDRQVDYTQKRTEYARRGVPVYLLFDPKIQQIRVDEAPDPITATYQETTTYGLGELVIFPGFPNLQRTVDEWLDPPLVQELIAQERRDRLAERQETAAERQRAELAEQQAAAERQRAELAEQQAAAERQQAQAERQRAELAEQRAARLVALLRSQGIETEDV